MKFMSVSFLTGNHWLKRGFRAVLGGAALLAAAGTVSVQADQVTTAPGFGPYQIGSGGEFTVTPDAPVAALLSGYSPFTINQGNFPRSFQTFCVERDEYITANTTYDVTLNSLTMFTGTKLTVGTAYLYQQFALGALTDYNYANTPGGSRQSAVHGSAFELQRALWYYMGEYSYDQYNIYMNGIVSLPANPFAADNGAHDVKILNLWAPGQPHDGQHSFQDVLIHVPEPSTAALLGVAALLAFRRRK